MIYCHFIRTLEMVKSLIIIIVSIVTADSSYVNDECSFSTELILLTCVRWDVSPWKPCSRTCGPGLQYRIVSCLRQLRNGTTVTSPGHLCPSDKPSGVQNCITKACYLNWVAGPWSSCHALCGVGFRLRNVRCPVMGQCADWEKPASRKSCIKGSCYDWTAGEWGACSAGCGFGTQRRFVTCRHLLSEKPANTCNAGSKPVSSRRCKIKECNNNGVVLETVCKDDKYSKQQCHAVLKFHLCSNTAWLDLCCRTCQNA